MLWIIGIIFCIIQVTVISYINIGGIVPDIVLGFIIYISLFYSSKGYVYGFIMGLLIDLPATPFGLNTLVYTLIGYVIGNFSYKIYKEIPIIWALLLIISSVSQQIIIYTIEKELTMSFFFRYIIPTGIYTTIIGMGIIYILRRRLQSKR